MRTDDLYEGIRIRGDLESTEAARESARATLETLAERISHGEAEQLAEGSRTTVRGLSERTGVASPRAAE